MKIVTINLFNFDELNQKAKEKAITDHAEFLLEVDGEEKERTREEVIENIIINEYWFFEDGELAHVTRYTGKHPEAGKEIFHFHGRIFELK